MSTTCDREATGDLEAQTRSIHAARQNLACAQAANTPRARTAHLDEHSRALAQRTARRERRGSERGRPRRGFTLIEAIVIIVIIGVLATLIAPRILKRVGQSKQAVAKSNASSLANAMRLFIADHGMPREGESIKILWERPSDVDPADWEPYVDSADKLLDPWGKEFVLEIPGKKNYDFDIVSYGADGVEGGSGEDADVVAP